MMDLYRKFIDMAFVKAISGNPALAFLMLGSLLFFASTRELIIFKVDIAPYLTDLGRTIVIAGVFSVILKSVQFSAVFRDIIMAAIYNPAHIDDEPLLLKNWRLITDAIFSKWLPAHYPRPTGLLNSRYIDSKADYHFSDFQIQYDIDVHADGKGSVSNTLKADILLAPKRKQPVFVQTIEGDGPTKLLWLRINDKTFATYDFQVMPDSPPHHEIDPGPGRAHQSTYGQRAPGTCVQERAECAQRTVHQRHAHAFHQWRGDQDAHQQGLSHTLHQ